MLGSSLIYVDLTGGIEAAGNPFQIRTGAQTVVFRRCEQERHHVDCTFSGDCTLGIWRQSCPEGRMVCV